MSESRRQIEASGVHRFTANRVWGLVLAFLVLLTAQPIRAQDPDAAARALIARHVGSWDIDAFLQEPDIHHELRTLLGAGWEKLMLNLGVTGSIEFTGGALAIAGNAPHRGTEEEAIVCVQPWGATPAVHAAIFSEGAVTVYTRQSRYDFMPTCVKDWITLVNSRHADRLIMPPNVEMAGPR